MCALTLRIIKRNIDNTRLLIYLWNPSCDAGKGSGGGAHTTVCGCAIPEHLLFNLTFAGYTNFARMPGAERYLKSRMDQTSVGPSQTHPRLFRLFFDLMSAREKFMPEAYFGASTRKLCDADKAIAADPFFQECFMPEEREAFRQGSKGVATDAAVHNIDWGLLSQRFPFRCMSSTAQRISSSRLNTHTISQRMPPIVTSTSLKARHLFPFQYKDMIFDTADAEGKGK